MLAQDLSNLGYWRTLYQSSWKIECWRAFETGWYKWYFLCVLKWWGKECVTLYSSRIFVHKGTTIQIHLNVGTCSRWTTLQTLKFIDVMVTMNMKINKIQLMRVDRRTLLSKARLRKPWISDWRLLSMYLILISKESKQCFYYRSSHWHDLKYNRGLDC